MWQAAFQKLIAKLSTEFINLGFGAIDESIFELLKAIGRFFDVDRAYLYEFSAGYRFMDNTHEWCSPGVPSFIESQRNVLIEGFEWWHGKISEMVSDNRVIFVEDPEQLRELANRDWVDVPGDGLGAVPSVDIAPSVAVTPGLLVGGSTALALLLHRRRRRA